MADERHEYELRCSAVRLHQQGGDRGCALQGGASDHGPREIRMAPASTAMSSARSLRRLPIPGAFTAQHLMPHMVGDESGERFAFHFLGDDQISSGIRICSAVCSSVCRACSILQEAAGGRGHARRRGAGTLRA